MGFDAIWISPIVTNTPGGYHGYWSQDLFGINPHFGTADDLRQLISVRWPAPIMAGDTNLTKLMVVVGDGWW
jgi:hypothetical protein